MSWLPTFHAAGRACSGRDTEACRGCGAGVEWLHDLRPQDAARLVWSYAVLDYRPAGFLDRLAGRATVLPAALIAG